MWKKWKSLNKLNVKEIQNDQWEIQDQFVEK